MKILIIGGGGREHALAWKVAQSSRVERVFVAPGNAGTAREPKTVNIKIVAEDIAGLLDFARDNSIDLTIVGPEAPLVAGIVDEFRAAGLSIFGPTKKAAQLEGSKRFSKEFLARHKIPTAAFAAFADIESATAYIRERGAPIVVKADGLAAGKGVVLAHSEHEAIATARDMLGGRTFGAAGTQVVIEEFLEGEEASFICMVNGEQVLPLATSQDHKARDDGDTGPNTGGMGAYSPAPIVTPDVYARIMHEVIEPAVRGMAAEDNPYTGFLYAGLMIDAAGRPRALEFNCRLGDPETQPMLMRLRSDPVELCLAALGDRFADAKAEWDPRVALGVVMAAGGYPGACKSGHSIDGLHEIDADDVKVFHAGTAERNGSIVTSGGRVLCVTALGGTVEEARSLAYRGVRRVGWEGAYYRTDIGYRAMNRRADGGSRV
ncbi:MAG: phosphoribosylamine--glycine ligase [Gammaproteobacteria bacterium]|nr:phosphoribosylamine--glycine ligase [Gammaproteobacteria bacterium]